MLPNAISPPEPLSPGLVSLRGQIKAAEIEPVTSYALWLSGDDPANVLRKVALFDPELHIGGYGWDPNWSRREPAEACDAMQKSAFVERFLRAARFLSYLRSFHRAKISYRRASGSWAAIAEQVIDKPVGNGAFVAAALALGFEVRPRTGTMETWLNLSEAAFSALPGVSGLTTMPATAG